MFLRHTKRKKDGKEHRYWSIVENRRIGGGGRVVQRPLLYLGEINDSQELAWRKSIAIQEEGALQPRTLSLFRRTLRGIAAGRLDRSVAAKRTAVVPAAPVGRMLVGAELVARA